MKLFCLLAGRVLDIKIQKQNRCSMLREIMAMIKRKLKWLRKSQQVDVEDVK